MVVYQATGQAATQGIEKGVIEIKGEWIVSRLMSLVCAGAMCFLAKGGVDAQELVFCSILAIMALWLAWR